MGIKSRIGYDFSESNNGTFQTFNCAEGILNDEIYFEASMIDVKKAAEIARAAFFIYKNSTAEIRSQFLNQIAERLERSKSKLIAQFKKESSLSIGRGEVELNRTILQLRTFADLALNESWRNPLFSVDLTSNLDVRSCNEPIGPVVVFGASNFPFAYSTIGGDSAAALAIGCPVIVKAHPLHAGTSELVAEIISSVAKELGLPNGVFSHLLANGYEVGGALVKHPNIKAVGFTGSINGGGSLMDISAKREEPIPVFAEMGSVNPVIFFKDELKSNLKDWIQKYAQSISNDAGQFCTKPGLLFLPKTASGEVFKAELEEALKKMEEMPQLHPSINTSFLKSQKELFGSNNEQKEYHAQPVLQSITSEMFQSDARYREEFFGPQSILVFYNDLEELNQNLALLSGQLTGTIIATEIELKAHTTIIEKLKEKAGRIIFNGVPTGVTVCDAMVHGGAYPASSDSRFTAVGSQSALRFARPVCYQNIPVSLLPVCLK